MNQATKSRIWCEAGRSNSEFSMRDDFARRSLIRTALRAPYLGRDEERDLAIRWKEKRDQEALNRITVAHMRLVISMATKFRGFGLPLAT